MYLIEYTEIETTIFLSVKKYFEGLPPTGTDDYTNAFFDLVAQYTGDGESYILVGDYFDDLVESTILDQINKLSFIEKTALKCFYEKHFLSNYLDEQGNDYVYTNEKLAVEVTSSFKSWIDDNFNLADMMDETDENDEDEEQDEDEQNENSLEQAIEKEDTIFVDDLFADTKEEEQLFDKYESEDQIKLITRIINSLLEKNLSNYQRRQLQVAQVYLSYHPIVPAEDYLITISFKNDFTFFEITYSHELIILSEYYTDDGFVFYNYNFRLTKTDRKEEEGELFDFIINATNFVEQKNADEIEISNE